ncbi:MAG TPA: hypothetical protein PLW65_30915, partial [Pseudomonadota bacterium]|nr:hypothetical protein [Pseudomonadota bacterium]
YAQQDRAAARALLGLGRAGIARQQGGEVAIAVAPAYGLADPDFAGQPVAAAAIAASGERAAVAHGRLLSVIELAGGYPIRRLAPHPERLRRLAIDRSGQRLATLADDAVVRLRSPSGDPGYDFPLLPPRDPARPGRLGSEAAHRAPWLDFSPDARQLFIADCGVAATGDCPLRRLRVVAADSGQLVQTFASGDKELLDYTADRDGTIALLFAGSPPRLFAARTGQELQLSSSLRGPAASACLGGSRLPAAGERALLVSPERRWLATLAPPATLCLWELRARRLAAAIALSDGPARLEALLSEDVGQAVVLSTPVPGSGRRSYLLFPQTGQRLAAPRGLAAVLPLDDGGALLTGRSATGRLARGPEVFRLHPDRRLQRLSSPQLLALPCLFAVPEAVQGDGARALFSATELGQSGSCPLALVELSGPAPAHLWRVALPGKSPLVAADFTAEQHLVMIDAQAQLQALIGTKVQYATPRFPAAVTRLDFSGTGEQLLIESADGDKRALWLASGQLRQVASPRGLPLGQAPDGASAAAPAAPSAVPSAAAPDGASAAAPDGASAAASGSPAGPALVDPSAAVAFSPDGRWRLVGGVDGTVKWRRKTDDSLRLRLQLVDGGAVVLGPDGRFELLGRVERPADYLSCRAAGYPIALPLCSERLLTPGLLAQELR